ncbi:MAG: glycoside hydrolase family 36 protein [Pseudolysinimonas sp.]|uniref:glycoside hydrolase family 36 protein n=1 Tax=Pseudolysinimonas sp. TaxID=2680009 RepID=UPI003263AFEB
MISWQLGVRAESGVHVITEPGTNAGLTLRTGGTGLSAGDGDFWIEVTAGEHQVDLDYLVVTFPAEVELGDLVWLNGYQSWSESAVRPLGRGRRPLFSPARLLKLHLIGDDVIAPAQRNRRAEVSHEVLAAQPSSATGAPGARLWASRLGSDAFTILEVSAGSIRAVIDVAGWRLAAGESARIAWLEARTGDTAPHLLRDWAGSLATAREVPAITGWTSWYRYYTDIDAERLSAEIDALAASEIRFDVFQIDDGFQAQIGDWLDPNPGFPNGVAPLAKQARDAGMLPGLWIAPFIVSKHSAVSREHPDWVLRDRRGRRVPAGWNPAWKGDYWLLDLELPEVQHHLAEVFRTARDDWGFGLFKLDFLFAAALDDRPGATRAQRMRRAMELLREWCGDAVILGCGVPLVSAAGLVDYCRVGADVEARWESPLRLLNYRERASTVSALRSTLARSWMDGTWFGIDPDVVILRTTDTRLDDTERRALFTMNSALGSLVFVSDDVVGYDGETARLLGTWDPPGAARVLAHTQVSGVDQVVTDRGVLSARLGRDGGWVRVDG